MCNGGAERVAATLAEGQKELGHSVYLAAIGSSLFHVGKIISKA